MTLPINAQEFINPSAHRRTPTLLAIRGPLTGTRLPLLQDRFVIGRGQGCDLVLEDALVSRTHATVERRALASVISDLESHTGVRVNGRPVDQPRALAPNDEIEIGASLFLYDSEFDLQNAEFTDSSVYFAGQGEETIGFGDVATPAKAAPERDLLQGDAIDLVIDLGRLLDHRKVPFGEALQKAAHQMTRVFRADIVMICLWDTIAEQVRPVAVHPDGKVLADGALLRRVYREGRAVLISDRPNLAPHPAPDAPAAPVVRSVIAAPLHSDGTAIGVLLAQRNELDAYSLKELRVLQAMGSLLGVFIEARQRTAAHLLRANYSRAESAIVGVSQRFRQALDLVARVADSPVSLLLLGETGTGKEVLAREAHRLSAQGRAGGPFVAVNCAAIPETLFESELFGHEKGAFTGAIRQQQGYIEQANGGTLFLDEIGEMSLAVQPKLLRFIQEKTFQRVGGTKLLRANVRLVAATNRNLLEHVKSGRFREDLYHRLAVVPVEIPALRERRADIRGLAEHFAQLHARNIGREVVGISDDAIMALERYDWPGNIRELSNCVERAVLLSDGKVLLPRHFILGPGRAPSRGEDQPLGLGLREDLRPLAEVEREHILRVLKANGGNQAKAAEALGIHRNTLRNKLTEYGAL